MNGVLKAPPPPVKRGHKAAPLQISTANPRYQRAVERVCACGARSVGELFAEIIAKIAAANPELAAFASERLERYSRLSPDIVRNLGGDRLPSQPLRMVRP